MGLKKRSKVSAQFNMSSLTDIIFLLLIFFMLTSTLVAPNALNLKLPGTSTQRVSSTDRLDEVRIDREGRYFFNNRRISIDDLDGRLARATRGRAANSVSIIIAPDRGADVEYVVAVMDLALRYDINGVLASEKE
jgi:biopolymer transport protein ExbD